MQRPRIPIVVEPAASEPAYSVATLVTDHHQRAGMKATFIAAGFTASDTEFLHIDNSGSSQTGAFRGLNALLNQSRAPYVILCHQDIRLDFDDRAKLDRCLAALERDDPNWALAGNAGGTQPGRLAMRITDPHGHDRSIGSLPARVQSLDENFIVVKREARIGFSVDLEGFHFYGADICLSADVTGYSAYVIDFHLRHLSPGRKSADFDHSAASFTAKWSTALRPRWLQTTCTLLPLNGNRLMEFIWRTVRSPVEKITRRLPGSSGWQQPNRGPQRS